MPIINRYNFLRWSTEPATHIEPDNLPRAYWMDRERCGYMPVLFAGDTFAFYTNSDSGALTTEVFSDLRLRLVSAITGATVADLIGTLNQDIIAVDAYNVFSTFTVPVVPDGFYRLQVYEFTGGAVVLESNQLVARSGADVGTNTVKVKFRNGRQFYKVRYQEIDPLFYQHFRLSISVLERQYETDKETYTEVVSGKQRTFQNYLRRCVKFETYYFDNMAHEAAAVMIEHDFVEINSARFRHKTPYKEPSDAMSKLGKGEFELYEEDFGLVNLCSTGPTVLLGDGAGSYISDGVGDGILVR